jgi:hypothetical protein
MVCVFTILQLIPALPYLIFLLPNFEQVISSLPYKLDDKTSVCHPNRSYARKTAPAKYNSPFKTLLATKTPLMTQIA